MKSYVRVFERICELDNIYLAYRKARKGKSKKDYVIKFENNLKDNLLKLRAELLLLSYKPKRLVNFIVRDPKLRKISKSDFRDRIVHHAICNVIEPIFDKSFIHDSYANRIRKGNLEALERFDYFKRKVSGNNSKKCYVLKIDIKHYFATINHKILLELVEKRIKCIKTIWLIKKILLNYSGGGANKKLVCLLEI